MKIRFVLSLSLLVAAAPVWAADAPYSGLQNRRIKALLSQEVGDLRAGRRMGMAPAVELNNYPGSRHVIDLSDQLGLSADQKSRVSERFDKMSARAQGARSADSGRRSPARPVIGRRPNGRDSAPVDDHRYCRS